MADVKAEQLAIVLSETAAVYRMPADEREKWIATGKDGIVVPHLPIPRGATLLTTIAAQRAVDKLVDVFVKELLDEGVPADKSVIDLTVRKCCGEILTTEALAKLSIDKLVRVLSLYVQSRTQALETPWIHYVPCALSDEVDAPPFSIGPVHFVHRMPVQPLKTNDAAQPWAHLSNAEEGSKGAESWAALDKALSGSNWVAWVHDQASDYEASREAALVHVEFAIIALQLAFDTEATRTFRHKWERRLPPMIQRLSHREGEDHLLKMQLMPEAMAPNLPEFSSKLIPQASELLSRAGNRILAVSDEEADKHCPAISERWLTALYWFGKSLREMLDSAAVIALGAALDIFGRSSGKTPQMVDFCSGILKLKETDVVYGDGMTLKVAVETIYSDGRSQLIHGGKAILKKDYLAMRTFSEAFVRLILLRSLDRIDAYCRSREANPKMRDSFDDFVRVVSSGRPQ